VLFACTLVVSALAAVNCVLSVILCVHPVEYVEYWPGLCCRVLRSALCCSVLRLLLRKAKYSYQKHDKILTFFMNLTLSPGTVLVPHFLRKRTSEWVFTAQYQTGAPYTIFKEHVASPAEHALHLLQTMHVLPDHRPALVLKSIMPTAICSLAQDWVCSWFQLGWQCT